jgi:UDP-N-acetyl-2-amino-2-deoxyglucuronate dehydrogenase
VSPKTFALIGAAGYVAPRHMMAIKAVGGDLTVAFDPKDSVGILDSYFPDVRFFVEYERFDRHLDKLRRQGAKVDYVSICSPNYLHDAHCRFALRSDADAICEKPLVLNPWNLDALAQLEIDLNHRISTILQLRLHPAITALKQQVSSSTKNQFDVDLTYVTPRGPWYQTSWKGDEPKSGGIATNIGIHFFDALIDVFGPVKRSVVHLRTPDKCAGYLECGRARVRWFLSIDRHDIPDGASEKAPSYRSVTVNGAEIEFSGGFNDLHVRSYEEILAGRGFGLADVRPSIELVSSLRNIPVAATSDDMHPFLKRTRAR